jgi:ADP-heptose:LPS heptosyltransferase
MHTTHTRWFTAIHCKAKLLKQVMHPVFLFGDKSRSKMEAKEVGQRLPHLILWVYITLPGKTSLVFDVELK